MVPLLIFYVEFTLLEKCKIKKNYEKEKSGNKIPFFSISLCMCSLLFSTVCLCEPCMYNSRIDHKNDLNLINLNQLFIMKTVSYYFQN